MAESEAHVFKQSNDFDVDEEQNPPSDKDNRLNDDKKEAGTNNCSTTKPGVARSRESIFISNAFSFLPPTDDEENGTGSNSAVPSGEQTVNSSADDDGSDNDGDDDDDNDDGDSDGGDDDDSVNDVAKEDKTATVNQVLDMLKSDSTNLLRNSSKDGTSEQKCSSTVDDESGGLHVTRVISMEFGFLSDKKYSDNLYEDKTLSTLEENDGDPDEKTNAVDASTHSAGVSAANSGVTMRQKSVISNQSVRPSNYSNQSSVYSDDEEDEEDYDVNINPGAWRKSKFIYISSNSDTTSDGSITDSPHSSPSPRHVHRLSIYPPQTLDTDDVADDILADEKEVFEMEPSQDLNQPPVTERSLSTSTTVSEKEFRCHYQSLKKTKIIRKASLNKTNTIRQQRHTHTVGHEVVLEKKEGETEFGFHVWGCRPMIISTVEEGSVADHAGLQIGDVLLTLNGIDVSEASVCEVVQITKKGLPKLTLGLSTENRKLDLPLCCGYLNKLGAGMLMKKWHRRWVELKSDHCLYYYKNKWDVDPLGAVPVVNYTVTKATEIKSPFAFKLTKCNARTYYFIAESETEMSKWADAIRKADQVHPEDSMLLDISSHNVGLPALSIRKPDCCGILYKMGNNKKTWRRRYCVLKEGCLFYYENVNSSTAKGVVHFHGYIVEDSIPYNKQFGFKLVPPDRDMRTFYFYAENETEKKRWTLAFTQTLSKWVMVSE